MKAIHDNDIDKLYLLLQQSLIKAGGREKVDRTFFFHGKGFYLEIPYCFQVAEYAQASTIFYSKNRPKTILLHPDSHAGLTFQDMEPDNAFGKRDLETVGKEIREILKRADGKIVFYEEGQMTGRVKVLWFDYKSFATDGLVYNIMFLFETDHTWIIGTFYCMFKDYDRWKPEILNMLDTIQIGEAVYEGV